MEPTDATMTNLRTKTILAVALLAAAVSLLTACAGAPVKAPAALNAPCNETPQWTTADAAGHPVGIFVCFGAENHLLYAARLLPQAAPRAAAKPVVEEEDEDLKRLKAKARRRREKARVETSEPSKLPPPPTHTTLPAVTGTAQ